MREVALGKPRVATPGDQYEDELRLAAGLREPDDAPGTSRISPLVNDLHAAVVGVETDAGVQVGYVKRNVCQARVRHYSEDTGRASRLEAVELRARPGLRILTTLTQTRGAALLLPVALALALSSVAACGPVHGPDTPNIVLISVDTLRADHLSSYGFGAETTPHMDALAVQSVLFERAVAASSSTAPSHASMLTSRYVREHSVGYLNGGTRLKGDTTLAELLRDAGYETGAFVSNYVLRRQLGFDRGFDTYDDRFPKPEPNRPEIFERKAHATTERALEWLGKADAPFFLWVHYQDPHGPYDPPAEYLGSAALAVDPEEEPIPLLSSNLEFGGVPAYQVLPGLTKPSQYHARYADEIRYVDHWIGELLAQPQLRDAIVLLTADHGESLGEAGRYFMHGTSSLPAEAHVPLLLRAPGVEPRRVAEMVSHLDVLPTLLELVGLEPPAGVRGVALGPYLRGEVPLQPRIVYCDMGLQTSAYREDRIVQVRRVAVVGGEPARRGHPIVRAYRWQGTEPSPVEGRGDPSFEELRAAITSYLRFDRAAMIEIDNLAPEDFERLRALGYID